MYGQRKLCVSGLACLLVFPSTTAWAQLPGRGGAGIGGARIGTGAPGLSNPRSGLGVRNSPVANPSPSLTPSQVLNPRGSINTGQVLNPKGSLNRPRTGVTAPNTKRQGARAAGGAGNYRSARPSRDKSDAGLVSDVKSRVAEARPIGEQVLDSVVALDTKITKVAPDKGYSERLGLDRLRAVPVFSEQPSGDKERKALEEIFKRYQAVAKDDKQATVNQLPEFKQTLTVLEEYLSPLHVRRQKRLELVFDQLHQQLGKYKNGAPWAEYLSLPDDSGQSPDGNAQITKLLARFDKLAGDRTYAKVTSLPGFGPAYAALKAVARKTETAE